MCYTQVFLTYLSRGVEITLSKCLYKNTISCLETGDIPSYSPVKNKDSPIRKRIAKNRRFKSSLETFIDPI